MSETVTLTIPHKLTRIEARQRLEHGFARVTEQMAGKAVAMEQRWEGDHLDFVARVMGSAITGRLDVEDHAVHLEVDLPWLLASLANTFKNRLRKETTRLLEKK